MNAQTVTRQDWLEANQRLLAEALAEERAWLSRRAGDEGKPGKVKETTVSPPALERLAGLFGLSEFERRLLLWCAGAELDAEFAGALAEAQHDPARRRPCFSLTLATLPGAH
ncbi:MAG TPA: hypothetical protein PJ988_18600, partial [Anaerolinea sp.]|nr:hypothetical protein [Anaerolinea sp.]